jgi:hypothetical protein
LTDAPRAVASSTGATEPTGLVRVVNQRTAETAGAASDGLRAVFSLTARTVRPLAADPVARGGPLVRVLNSRWPARRTIASDG